jgi:anaerobic selenocysteine-containing dehydrogenase
MLGLLVQEKLLASEWLALHANGLGEILPHFADLPIAKYCEACGVPEALVRNAARRIASASSVASFEDLGVQMNRHSTLVSYLHKLLILLTGNFGKKGTSYIPTMLTPFTSGHESGAGSRPPSGADQYNAGAKKRLGTPVTGARLIGGLTPCNVIPDEILSDHPKRFRAMLVESGNPAHSLADSARMREALAALDLLVVVDVAFTETARPAHYVLPVASQFEKAEATFFNFEFPDNYFHLRKPLMPPLPGLFSEAELHCRLLEALGQLPAEPVTALRAAWKEGRKSFREKFGALAKSDPRVVPIAPTLLYRAIGELLPGLAEGAGVWLQCQSVAQTHPVSLARAGFTGEPEEAGDALFDAILAAKSGLVFAVDTWEECFERLRTPNHRVQLAVPELFGELDALATEIPPQATTDFPFMLSAGERRSFTANTIIRNPDWRRKDAGGALSINPEDAKSVGVADGKRARITTGRGSVEVLVQVSDRMQRGHLSLPNGLGLDFPAMDGHRVKAGVGPNELTRREDRDWIAGTPWHKSTPARVEPL